MPNHSNISHWGRYSYGYGNPYGHVDPTWYRQIETAGYVEGGSIPAQTSGDGPEGDKTQEVSFNNKDAKFFVYGEELQSAFIDILNSESGRNLLNDINSDEIIDRVMIELYEGKDLGITTPHVFKRLVSGTGTWEVPDCEDFYQMHIVINMDVRDPTFYNVYEKLFTPSITRVLARELGHVGNFVKYRSLNIYNNSIVYENLIMKEIGECQVRHPNLGHE